jgi:hypothetical protein
LGVGCKIPEIVVVGGQSDGKSSVTEALLGFKFNHVANEMGTRRPIILQMVHDPHCAVPLCHFVREDNSQLEENPTAWDQVAQRIQDITDKTTAPEQVSPQPITIHIAFARAPNLTLIDTPGFVRLGRGNQDTGHAIKEMVTSLVTGPNSHRFIVCLEQATVEWRNPTDSREFINQVDPEWRRSMLVVTKLDNRLNQINTAAELNTYLSTSGYVPIEPLFISLPARRVASTIADFQRTIEEHDRAMLQRLRAIGFEDKYTRQLGLDNLTKYLASIYRALIRDHLGTVVQAVLARENELRRELGQVEATLAQYAPRSVRANVNSFAHKFAKVMEELIKGDIATLPEHSGQTLAEELHAAGFEWRNLPWMNLLDFSRESIPDAVTRVHGGAQFRRMLVEFEVVVRSMEMPDLLESEIATATGVDTLNYERNVDHASSNIALIKFRQCTVPLLPQIEQRLSYIGRRFIDVALLTFSNHNRAFEAEQTLKSAFRHELELFVEHAVHEWARLAEVLLGTESHIVNMTPHMDARTECAPIELYPTREAVRARVRMEMQRRQPHDEDSAAMNERELVAIKTANKFAALRNSWLQLLVHVTNSYLHTLRRSTNEWLDRAFGRKTDEELELLLNHNQARLRTVRDTLQQNVNQIRVVKEQLAEIRRLHY